MALSREDQLARDILDFDQQMVDVKVQYEPVFRDIIDYVITHQPSVSKNTTQGQPRGQLQFDGTPRSALNIFTNGIHALMVAPTMRWFKLGISDEDINQLPEVKIWLQDTEERLYKAFQRSNFYSEMKSYIKDGGSIGTACMYSEEDIATGKIFFTTIPIREFMIAENQYKVIDRVHREFELTARQLKDKFGEENLTHEMQVALNDVNASRRLQKFKILHVVFPRKDSDDRKIGQLNKPFASIWLSLSSDKHSGSTSPPQREGKILGEKGYDEFPYSIWRFDKETDELYGRSPAWHILSEIIGAHVLEKDLLKAAELFVNPPMNVHTNMKGKFRRKPGGINYFKDPDEKADAMDLKINYPVGIEQQDRKRNIINSAYFVDFFLLITSRDTTMTATEVLELQGEKIAILAPIVTSLSSEALDQNIDRVFSIEFNAGRLLDPPPVLAGQQIDIDYIGPLAQAQRRAFETQGIIKSLENARSIIELFPQTADNVDWDGVARDVLQGGGFPEKHIIPEQIVLENRQVRQEQEAALEETLNNETQSKTLKNVALADKAVDGKISEAVAQ